MKKIIILLVIISFFLIVAPLISFSGVGFKNTEPEDFGAEEENSEPSEPQESSDNGQAEGEKTSYDLQTDIFNVYIKARDEVVPMTALDYITGVVAAEMPAVFNPEALKAQAVASYTYACYMRSRADKNPNNAIKGADLSDQSTAYQAFRNTENLKEIWGDDFEKYYSKVRSAVSEVIGKLIVYDDEPIMAAFHAMSWGKTENCGNVWGGDISYLVSVDSHEDSASDSFMNTFLFTREEFIKKLSLSGDKVSIGEITYTDAGMVDSVSINSKKYTGMEIRLLFSLASPCFTLTESNGSFIFTTKGKGHGVGLSQNGANELANEGLTWEEIILHYYRDVTII